MSDLRFSIRAVAWTVALALSLTALAVGCGSDDDGGGGGGQGGAAQAEGSGAEPASNSGSGEEVVAGGPKEQIRATLEAIQQDFIDLDAESYCSRLSQSARAEVARFGKTYGHGDSCVEAIDRTSRLTKKAGVEQKPTKLLSFIEVKGNQAFAKVSNGGREAEALPFLKEGGKWRLAESGLDDAKVQKKYKLDIQEQVDWMRRDLATD